MRGLNICAVVVALLISSGEIVRYWGSARFAPLAFDELLVAAALLWAAWRSPRDGALWHVAAWSALCGLALVLFVQTADHQMHGPAKAAGPVYLTALGGMLLLGLWAVRKAYSMARSTAAR